MPVALGGDDSAVNLVTACRDCNSGKASTSPDEHVVEDVAASAARWSAAMRQAAEQLRDEAASFDQFMTSFHSGWHRWIPDRLEPTLRSLHDAGLPADAVREVAEIACAARGVNDRAAYFAAIAWKRVRRMQELAHQFLEEADDGA